MKVSTAHGIAMGTVIAAMSIYNNPPSRPLEWGDYLLLGLFGALMIWLLSHRERGDAAAEDRTDQSFAFRVGKALNRIRRGKSV